MLDAAAEADCTSVVHVSSTFALLQPNAMLSGESPLGVALGPYTQSKVDSERIARERQGAGAPVSIVNPGSVVGPNDPYLGESNTVVRDVLRGRLPTWPKGRLQWVDVRDTAEVIVAALDRPGRRYVVPGESVALPHEALRRVTGRRLPAVRVPVQAATPMLKLGYRTDWPLIPYALEGARGIAMGTEVDYSGTVAELGIKGRSLDESDRHDPLARRDGTHLAPRCRPQPGPCDRSDRHLRLRRHRFRRSRQPRFGRVDRTTLPPQVAQPYCGRLPRGRRHRPPHAIPPDYR